MTRTPGTRLEWHDLAGWMTATLIIGRRRATRRIEPWTRHVAALPAAMIAREADADLLREVRDLFLRGPSGLCQPLRGHRAEAPQTALIVAINNRLAVIAREADRIEPGPNWLAIHGADGT
ncbi:hypothetical protein [Jannaschia rubra]|uniref:Uncharacterized protein n=1 Tax=Jannaschia rubra TaxID=282197 RepID=A0A0M6XTE7_9RHOB|nr:hypothetical protein [Jannaschia rubra]CTQ34439.1 hypothetical protein JAN5088_03235 [Jannaschia rubra]